MINILLAEVCSKNLANSDVICDLILFQALFLSMWTVGGPRTFCDLLPRFPGLFLFPVFGPFMFGPQNCCRSGNNNSKMQLSFFHTYVNILIWGAGAVVSINFSPRSYYTQKPFLLVVLPVMGLLAILTFLYQISEKACCLNYFCCCCSTCFCPCTERSLLLDEDQKEEKVQHRRMSQENQRNFEMAQLV